jgi:hypothetical protein
MFFLLGIGLVIGSIFYWDRIKNFWEGKENIETFGETPYRIGSVIAGLMSVVVGILIMLGILK